MSDKSKQLRMESELRRSYRKFLPDPIPADMIKDWIMTASSAPSGANKQPWFFYIVTKEEMKATIRREAEEIEKAFYEEKISDTWRSDLKVLETNDSKAFLTQAPCLIVVFKELYKINSEGIKEKNYYPNECVGLASGMLINAIRHSGYKSLTYTPAPMNFLKDIFKVPEGQAPVMILAVGKGDESFIVPDIHRKSFEEVAKIF